MIIVLEHDIRPADKKALVAFLEGKGFRLREIQGEQETVIGAVGIVPLDVRQVELLPGVARVIPITQPFKLASREFRREDTLIPVGPVKVGGPRIVVIAGPCAVESREHILEVARHREGLRRGHAAGRGLQAAHLPVRLPGPGRGGPGLPQGGRARPRACPWCPRS